MATLVSGDGEVGGDGGIHSGEGVLVEAVTLTQSEDNFVGSSSVVGVGLYLEGQLILADGDSVGELLSALGLSVGGNEVNNDETRASGVGDLVLGSDGEGGSNGSRLGGRGDTSERSSSASNLGAGVELLAVPDGIGVSMVDDLDELLNSNIVADKVASNIKNLAGEEVAELSTSTHNSTVQELIEQVVEALIHEVETDITCGGGLDGGGLDGDGRTNARGNGHEGKEYEDGLQDHQPY